MPPARLLGRRLGLAQGAFTADRSDLRIGRSRTMSVQGAIGSDTVMGHNDTHCLGVRRKGHHRGDRCLHGTVAVAVVVLSIGLPAKATATPGYEVHPGGVRFVVPVQHSGDAPPEHSSDYVVAVTAQDHQHVQLSLETPSSKTEYWTRGSVSSRRIKARFGTFGRIDLRLRLTPLPATVHTEKRCKGPAPVYMEGTYSGVIAFASLEGLPKLVVKRGRLYFVHRFKQVCKGLGQSIPPIGATALMRKSEVGILAVNGHVRGRTVSLEGSVLALKGHPARTTGRLVVGVRERSGGVRITRTTNLAINRESFAMSEPGETPETVEVVPPMPFSGRALYVRSPGSSPSWTGDLSIGLSDSDMLPLTGPGFSATMCRGSWMTRFKHCRMP